jgi:hypothetical protein
MRRHALAAAAAAVLATALAACGTSGGHAAMPGMHHGAMPSATGAATGSTTATTATTATPRMPDMPGMGTVAGGDGLSDHADGYRLTSTTTTLPAGTPAPYRFTVAGPDGRPVTAFRVEQTKRLHFYAIRSDLTGFQHLHPVMAEDGTWTARPAALAPGSWRMFATFTPAAGPGEGTAFVLSRPVTVPGAATTRPLPAASSTATADGYTVTVKGDLMAGMEHPLTVHLATAKDGRPVTGLQPYLDSYAHLTAFHEGDAAFAHLHPATAAAGGHGGPDLSFHAELPKPGNWRMFLQFRAAGTLHTAALTLHVS